MVDIGDNPYYMTYKSLVGKIQYGFYGTIFVGLHRVGALM